MRRRDAKHQTPGGKDTVVRTHYRSAQPANVSGAMSFPVVYQHGRGLLDFRKESAAAMKVGAAFGGTYRKGKSVPGMGLPPGTDFDYAALASESRE